MSDLVVIQHNKPFTTSLILSEGVQLEHRAVLKLIRKYKSREIFNILAPGVREKKRQGPPTEFYYLTESQAIFLITLMSNSEKILDFKEALVIAFMKYRQLAYELAVNKNNAEHIAKRSQSKQMRLEETDMIKKFVNYAADQGSSNAHRYYSNISTMETKALFFVEQKYPNMREVMNLHQLCLIEAADRAVICALEEGMEQKLPYKEIYIKAKERVEALAKIFPKSPLPALLTKD